MAKQKFISSKFTEVVDQTTGEVLQVETSKTYSKRIDAEKFYMVFIDYVAPLYELKSDGAKSVLSYLCSIATFNTGKVALTTATRKTLCETLGISTNSLTNYLNKLKAINLISGEKGDFTINPQVFWKGSTEERDKILKNSEIQITFDIKRRE